jgi:hypothetical protein
MKELVHNPVCKGQFNGGEIEPGTFHKSGHISSKIINGASNNEMPDYDGEEDVSTNDTPVDAESEAKDND